MHSVIQFARKYFKRKGKYLNGIKQNLRKNKKNKTDKFAFCS